MKKFILTIIVFLCLVPLLFADVNEGIRSRAVYDTCRLDAGQADTSEIIFDLSGLSEQGIPSMALMTDTTDTFNVWFCSGVRVAYFGAKDTAWSTPVQCVWEEVITSKTAFGPINIAFLQSLVLSDSSDGRTGFMPAEYFKVMVEPAGDSLETVLDHLFLAKILFK